MALLLLKKRIDERGDGRSACQYYQDSEKKENDYGRQKPEFFPLSEKSYQVTNEFHNAFLSIGVSNVIRRVQMIPFGKYGRCVLFPLFQLQRFGTAHPLEYPERGDDQKKNKR
jgi:hypothetical protein